MLKCSRSGHRVTWQNRVHNGKTVFRRSRLATEDVRRLLHVINGAQHLTSPAAVLSPDVTKAFHRLWSFLWSVLQAMAFGMPFCYLERIETRSSLSLLLFALSLEPLAQAICCSPTFLPISIKGTHHHISLYADDNPAQCIPRILSVFEQYGKPSSFKIKWQRSALLPLKPGDVQCSHPRFCHLLFDTDDNQTKLWPHP